MALHSTHYTKTMNPFQNDLCLGQQIEQHVRQTLFKNIDTAPASKEEQHHGIDFHAFDVGSISVEIKRDTVLERSGNFFAEITHGRNLSKPGWLKTCQADMMIVVGNNNYYAFIWPGLFPAILAIAPYRRWKSRTVYNEGGFNAGGLLIPIEEICKYRGQFAPFKDFRALLSFHQKLTQFKGNW